MNIHVNRYGEKDIAPVTDTEYVKVRGLASPTHFSRRS